MESLAFTVTIGLMAIVYFLANIKIIAEESSRDDPLVEIIVIFFIGLPALTYAYLCLVAPFLKMKAGINTQEIISCH